MPRQPKPWYLKDRKIWMVTIAGVRHNLGSSKNEAFDRYYKLMRQPKQLVAVPSREFVAIADRFLDWVQRNRSPDTYEWYRYRLERFCQRYPTLIAEELKPFHVQEWVDSYDFLGQTSRRNYIRSVKRCVNWAVQQGHLESNSLRYLQAPSAERKEVQISTDDFSKLLALNQAKLESPLYPSSAEFSAQVRAASLTGLWAT